MMSETFSNSVDDRGMVEGKGNCKFRISVFSPQNLTNDLKVEDIGLK